MINKEDKTFDGKFQNCAAGAEPAQTSHCFIGVMLFDCATVARSYRLRFHN